MKRRPPKQSLSNLRAKAKRSVDAQAKAKKRQMEVRASWAAGILSVTLAGGSLAYFLQAIPPYQGRGAALAAYLYGHFGQIGPALPWLAISAILAFISIAAARGWGDDVD